MLSFSDTFTTKTSLLPGRIWGFHWVQELWSDTKNMRLCPEQLPGLLMILKDDPQTGSFVGTEFMKLKGETHLAGLTGTLWALLYTNRRKPEGKSVVQALQIDKFWSIICHHLFLHWSFAPLQHTWHLELIAGIYFTLGPWLSLRINCLWADTGREQGTSCSS